MSVLCACGKRIVRCDCGGTACPGWGHLPPAARHWCGRTEADGKPMPADSASRDLAGVAEGEALERLAAIGGDGRG